MSAPYIFHISGMTCTSCSNSIQKMLSKKLGDQLKLFDVDITTPDPKKLTVILQEDEPVNPALWQELADTIDDMGFECEPWEEEQSIPPNTGIWTKIKNVLFSHWFLGALGCITGFTFLIISLIFPVLPFAAMLSMGIISIILTLLLGARSYYHAAVKLFKSGTLTMDLLFSISTLTIIGVSIASFFVPFMPMMFDVGLLTYGFRHIGLGIEESIKEQISSRSFKDRAPKEVSRIHDEEEFAVDVNEIEPGDIISIQPGQIIPVDGICESDSALFNTIVTGSTVSHGYKIGDKVLAGMRVAEHAPALKLKANKNFAKSYLAKLDENIEQSLLEKAPIEHKTDKILTYFIPLVLLIAVISLIVVSSFFPWAIAIQCAVSVLVSLCPCTLGLIIPLAVKTGIQKSAEYGVQFKNAKAIQDAAEVDIVVVDYHGTMTTGIPAIARCELLPDAGISKQDLLNLTYTLEQNSKHTIGKALFAYAEKNAAVTQSIEFDDLSHHAGIRASIDAQPCVIGSAALMQEQGIDTKELEASLTLDAGDSLVYLAKNNKLIGYFVITQPLRKDAKEAIAWLKKLGKQVHLCTGADEATANRCAQALDIDIVYADSVGSTIEESDRSKPAYIQGLMDQGYKVAMVGDGANDAHALAASHFGIAVASETGDEITQNQAGAVIQSDSLMSIVSTFVLANQTVSNIKQNLLISLGYNATIVLIAAGILLTVGFALNPAIGAALMGLQACVILAFVYRFKHKLLPHLQENLQEESILDNTTTNSTKKIFDNLPKCSINPELDNENEQQEIANEPLFMQELTQMSPPEENATLSALPSV